MPPASRGPRLAASIALLILGLSGAGCQSVSPLFTSALQPGAPFAQPTPAAPKGPPKGLLANVQAMTGSWTTGQGATGSPTATLYRQPTPGVYPGQYPATNPYPGANPNPQPVTITSHRPGLIAALSNIQPVGGRQPNEVGSKGTPGSTASQIPVTTLPLPPSAFGGTSVVSQPNPPMQPMQPAPGTGMDKGMNPIMPETFPAPRTVNGNGNSKTATPSTPPAGPWPAPMVEVGPVAPYYPQGHRGVPVAADPFTRAVHGLQDKFNAAMTAQPIRNAMPVPPEAPREFQKRSLPPYIIEPPDVLLVQCLADLGDLQTVNFEHRVRPDGTISLGIYGEVYVAGMTLAQAKQAIVQVLSQRLKKVDHNNTVVDIIGYASKRYYVITDGAGNGEQVYPFPITGNETVLDAIANINGLPIVSSRRNIWLARATPDGSPYPKIMPVDWKGVSQYGSASTNYQIMPNDRVYVKADHLRTLDGHLSRVLSPIERVFGTVLLGSSTINNIRGGGQGNNNNFGN